MMSMLEALSADQQEFQDAFPRLHGEEKGAGENRMEQAEIYSCSLRRVTPETPTSNQTRLTAPGVSTA
jgi:hypothetical protein